ncbi:hypothetical protein [Desulfopila inferna]|uniref:hypothetical protein n=1 Tax=Desulfopila inferna TaxID=468528 RepID=UPI00196554D6|nr:hypothetical protein [Desulfopila inferna]MBM9605934.1 hypothetical protein [Desulfopila inferna]
MEDDKILAEIESLKKKINFLRVSVQVDYTLIPPVLMSIKKLAEETGKPEMLQEIRMYFQSALDNMSYTDMTLDESFEIAQNVASLILKDENVNTEQ